MTATKFVAELGLHYAKLQTMHCEKGNVRCETMLSRLSTGYSQPLSVYNAKRAVASTESTQKHWFSHDKSSNDWLCLFESG